MGGAVVMFEPSARTAWHTHPLGQTLIVTAGYGWFRCDKKSQDMTLALRLAAALRIKRRRRRLHRL